ncbi:unnamed protein product [Urochloa humidicola]
MAASPFLLLVAAALLCSSPAAAPPKEHLVTGLPGFHGNFPSNHYSGYVTVDDASERSLFYYLALSERDPAADPVVLWLNGGPGCSSFDGFVYENGPFNFEPPAGSNPGGLPRLQLNPYSWSKELKDLNKYNILAPCYHHPEIQEAEFANSSLPLSFRRLGQTDRPFPVRKRMAGRSWPLRLALRGGRVPMWPSLGGRSLPCTSDELATAWLDDEDVRAAIHAKSKSLIGSWELYTARIDYTHDTGTMVSYHKKFTALGYRVLIYSGDHDLCIPFPGTEAWVQSIGYQIIDRWRPWYFGDQVAGYTQGYDHNLTFLTIKGAGHAVPEYKPKESLAFYSRWLAGEKF